jgi:hypothetical protein
MKDNATSAIAPASSEIGGNVPISPSTLYRSSPVTRRRPSRFVPILTNLAVFPPVRLLAALYPNAKLVVELNARTANRSAAYAL